MNQSAYSKYLKDDNTLDYQLLYADIAEITGFNHFQSRGTFYKAVTDWHSEVITQTPTGKETKVNETVVVDIINKESNRVFRLVDDEFSRYDAEDKDYLVEIKIRHKWYPDCIIEHDKYEANIALAKEANKEFLYSVYVKQDSCYDIYIFNCTTLAQKDYKFRWDWKELPKSTELGESRNLVVKFVGFIDIDKASAHYKGELNA